MLCHPNISSEFHSKHFMDGIFSINKISGKSDTVISCTSYQRMLNNGLRIDANMSKTFNLKYSPDSTITLINAFKHENEIIAFFLMEYSDLSEAIINLYHINGDLKDTLQFNVDCSSDVVDSDEQQETLIQHNCVISLNGNVLIYTISMIESIYNIETETYIEKGKEDVVSMYRFNNQRFKNL